MDDQEKENVRKGRSMLTKFGAIDPRLDRTVRKYFAGRRSNDSAFDDIFQFYYDKGDLSAAGITIEEYDELDWNPSVRISAEVVESAELDDELFDYLRDIIGDNIEYYGGDDDEDVDDVDDE